MMTPTGTSTTKIVLQQVDNVSADSESLARIGEVLVGIDV